MKHGIVKHTGALALVIMILMILTGCAASRKHHRSIPCPCEKHKRL